MKQSGTVLINPPADTELENQAPTETNDEEVQQNGQSEVDKLEKIVDNENKILYEVSSVFPFQLFPDKILIYPSKIMVVHKNLFFKNIFPVLISDLNTVRVSRGLIFASIKFEIRSYEENPGAINFLWPEHASKAESLIIGLLSAVRNRGIDVSKIPIKQAKRVVRKLGESKEKIEKIL